MSVRCTPSLLNRPPLIQVFVRPTPPKSCGWSRRSKSPLMSASGMLRAVASEVIVALYAVIVSEKTFCSAGVMISASVSGSPVCGRGLNGGTAFRFGGRPKPCRLRAGGGGRMGAGRGEKQGDWVPADDDRREVLIEDDGRQPRGQRRRGEVGRERAHDHAGVRGACGELVEHRLVLRGERRRRGELGRVACADGAEEVVAADPDGDEGRMQRQGLIDLGAEADQA